jgi:hypothetical protein
VVVLLSPLDFQLYLQILLAHNIYMTSQTPVGTIEEIRRPSAEEA